MRAGLTVSRFPFVGALGSTSRRELAAQPLAFAKPHQHLVRRGQQAGGAYFVVRGALRVFYVSARGRESTLYRVEPGGTCVLALASTFGDEAYPAWVDAGERGASFVRVPAPVLQRLFDAEPALRTFVFGVITTRVFELMRTIEELSSDSVEQRLARLLLRRVDEERAVRTTQEAIASELATAREVVARALRALAERGLVKRGRMRIEVLDARALRLVADT